MRISVCFVSALLPVGLRLVEVHEGPTDMRPLLPAGRFFIETMAQLSRLRKRQREEEDGARPGSAEPNGKYVADTCARWRGGPRLSGRVRVVYDGR